MRHDDGVHSADIPIARPSFGQEEEAVVLEVLRSGKVAQGARVTAFQERFAAAVGGRYAVATSNGTTALFLALLAHGVGPGTEVITSPLTFIASGNAIAHTGARPVFADVDESLNLSPSAAAAAITERTAAIMPVHLHGNPADMPAFADLAARHHIALIQDACQAVGATIDGQPLGSFGTACYSLYATKNITTGEGGMVVTNDESIAATCSRLRHQAYSDQPYVHDGIGFNFRMTELQAAIGLVQIERLQRVTDQRRDNATYYDRTITGPGLFRPRSTLGHVYHQYTLRVNQQACLTRDDICARLSEAGISTGIYYPVPVHRQPAYLSLANPPCPEAEKACADMFSIPVHPGVTPSDRERVARALDALQANTFDDSSVSFADSR